MENNFLSVIPNSEFFISLNQIIAWVEQQDLSKEELLLRLKNSMKNGYDLYKTTEILENNVNELKELNKKIEEVLKKVKF